MNKNSSSGLSFVTETQLEEKRKQRQQEWEEKRTEDQPLEAPEEEYDPRTLYQRLKEQKDKKDEEYEESKKLKHLIKGLDNEEISFLEMVDNNKIQIETQRLKEEMDALDEFKRAVSHLNDEEQEKRVNLFKEEFFNKNQTKVDNTSNKSAKKSSQSALMANLVRKRTKSETNDDKSPKKLKSNEKSDKIEDNLTQNMTNKTEEPIVECIGVLPGLGLYASDSSDSEDSSNSDNERAIDFSLIVRQKRKAPTQETKTEATHSTQ